MRQNGELEVRHGFVPQRKGTSRLLFFANTAHMGSYREAVNAYMAGEDATPTITKHEHFGALKYGFGYNVQQELSENARFFGRFGWNEGQHESFAYTEVDQTVEPWRLCRAALGIGPRTSLCAGWCCRTQSSDHQDYLRYGGLGFLVGDGKLNYGRENIVRAITPGTRRGLFYPLDVQHFTILALTKTGVVEAG